jgi:hypothetical protein
MRTIYENYIEWERYGKTIAITFDCNWNSLRVR